jgi:hypothetical protein
MTSFLVAVVSGLVMLWSLFQLIRHIVTEARMGAAIYGRLRGSNTLGQLYRAKLREPLLGVSKEAAPLPETRTMMRSYWMKGLWGLIFIASLFVFYISIYLLTK